MAEQNPLEISANLINSDEANDKLSNDNPVYSEKTNEGFINAPRDILQVYALYREESLHVGKQTIITNMEAYRSFNRAIIFTYGCTGAGKSETLNTLFRKKIIQNELTQQQSDTKSVIEYAIKIRSDKLKINNLEIGFIDVPGCFDTSGTKQDAINLAAIKKFIKLHPQLGNNIHPCYPNIVMVIMKSQENRLNGIEIATLLNSLKYLRIVDTINPNVVIVLTHAMRAGTKSYIRNVNKEKKVIQDLVEKLLGIIPPVVHIENKPEDHDLPYNDGNWQLPDGTLEPKDLYEQITQIMENSNDRIGAEAIQLFFVKKSDLPTPYIKFVLPRNLVTPNESKKCIHLYLEEKREALKNKVTNSIDSYCRTDLQINWHYFISLNYALYMKGIREYKDIEGKTLMEMITILHPYILNSTEKHVLIKVFNLKPLNYPLIIIQEIGKSCNKNYEEKEQIFKPPTETHNSCGVSVPNWVEVKDCDRVIVNCVEEDQNIIQTQDHNGMPLNNNGNKNTNHTYSIEIYQYTAELNLQMSQDLNGCIKGEFVQEVSALPIIDEKEENISPDIIQHFREFFSKYGEYIICRCNVGGRIETRLELPDGIKGISQIPTIIKCYIENYIKMLPEEGDEVASVRNSKYSSAKDKILFDVINKCKLTFTGGNIPHGLKRTTLEEITKEDYDLWKSSLQAIPVLLENVNNICHIQDIIKLIGLKNHESINRIGMEISEMEDGCKVANAPLIENSRYYGERNIDLLIGGNCLRRSSEIFQSPAVLLEKSADHTSNINRQPQTREIERNVMIERSARAETEQVIRDRPQVSTQISAAWYGFPPISKIDRLNRNDEPETVEIRDIVEGDRVRCLGPKSIFQYIAVIEIIQDNEREIAYRVIHHKFGKLMIGDKTRVLSKRNIEKVRAEDLSLQDIIYYYNDTSSGELLGHCHIRALSTKKEKGNYQLVLANQNAPLVVDKIIVCGQEAGCFPRNALITLKRGDKIPINQLRLGQSVLSVDMKTNKLLYTKVYLWAHRQPHTVATFLRIVYQGGTAITLTHNHLLPTNTAADEYYTRPKMLPASQLKVGDIIYTTTATSSNMCATPVRVLSISTCSQTGYYAPLTNNSVIAVDGVVASVFSLPASSSSSLLAEQGKLTKHLCLHTVAHHLFTPLRIASEFGLSHSLDRQMDNRTSIHKYCSLLLNLHFKAKSKSKYFQ